MRSLSIIALALTLLLVSLSAYLRLDHSGIGCANWPDCYAMIGMPDANAATVDQAYDRLLNEAAQPLSWAAPLHRLVASVLGLLVLAMTLLALAQKRDRALASMLLGLTVFLAWLGIHSSSLHNPAVVMGNLGGGMLMLGLLGWMVMRPIAPQKETVHGLGAWPVVAIVLLALQIGSGGLTSANFAAAACPTVPDCNGSYLPGAAVVEAFDLSRTVRVNASGRALGGAERAAIHKLHRLLAVLTSIAVVVAAAVAWSRGLIALGSGIALLVVAEFGVGVAAVLADIPIVVAVAHNWLAAILLLVLLRLLAHRQRAAGTSANERHA